MYSQMNMHISAEMYYVNYEEANDTIVDDQQNNGALVPQLTQNWLTTILDLFSGWFVGSKQCNIFYC